MACRGRDRPPTDEEEEEEGGREYTDVVRWFASVVVPEAACGAVPRGLCEAVPRGLRVVRRIDVVRSFSRHLHFNTCEQK